MCHNNITCTHIYVPELGCVVGELVEGVEGVAVGEADGLSGCVVGELVEGVEGAAVGEADGLSPCSEYSSDK